MDKKHVHIYVHIYMSYVCQLFNEMHVISLSLHFISIVEEKGWNRGKTACTNNEFGKHNKQQKYYKIYSSLSRSHFPISMLFDFPLSPESQISWCANRTATYIEIFRFARIWIFQVENIQSPKCIQPVTFSIAFSSDGKGAFFTRYIFDV